VFNSCGFVDLNLMEFSKTRLIATTLLIASIAIAGCARRSASNIAKQNALPGLTEPIRLSSQDTDAAEPAMASAPDGSVYVAWVNHRQTEADVMIARLGSDGRQMSAPVRVNPQAGIATAWRGDPPTIAVAPDQTVFVGWTARTGAGSAHATDVYLSASHDQGTTFAAPVKINDDAKPAVHGMHSLAIGRDGRIYVAWLDERNVAPDPMKDMKMEAKSAGHHMENNREVFIASSTDGGRSFSANQKVASNVCPCCKTALAVNSEDRLFISWRQVLPGDFRHIAVASSTDRAKTFSKPTIVSDDQWMLAGCPVSGSSLSAGNDGSLKVLWYSEGKNGQTGLYWSESLDGAVTFGARHLLAAGTTRGTPVLLNEGKRLSAIWQTIEGNSAKILWAPVLVGAPSLIVASAGELPVASSTAERVFVSYIAKGTAHQEVLLTSRPLSLEN
jgi:hypothetical protein